MAATIYKTLHRKLKMEQHTPPKNAGTPEGLVVPAPRVTPVVLL